MHISYLSIGLIRKKPLISFAILLTALLISTTSCRKKFMESSLESSATRTTSKLNNKFLASCVNTPSRAYIGLAEKQEKGFALQGESNTSLAKKAYEVLETNCEYCHNSTASIAEGGHPNFDILEYGQIAELKNIITTIKSYVSTKQMPPPASDYSSEMSDLERQILVDWVDAGAPSWIEGKSAFELGYISPESVRHCVRKSFESEYFDSDADRKFLRYISFAHFSQKSGFSKEILINLVSGLNSALNHTSTNSVLKKAKPIDKIGLIYQIDLRHYNWHLPSSSGMSKWDQIYQKISKFSIDEAFDSLGYKGHELQGRVIKGDVLIAAISQGSLYYDLLDIPKDIKQLEQDLKVDINKGLQNGTTKRLGLISSGVSRSNRLLERSKSRDGYYWKSYDFATSFDNGNLLGHPFGPRDLAKHQKVYSKVQSDLIFSHDGGEIIYSLPNGLHGFALTDKADKILFSNNENVFSEPSSEGPLSIVSDDNRTAYPGSDNGSAVVNAYSCIGCHYNGIKWAVNEIIDIKTYKTNIGPSHAALLNSYVGAERSQTQEFFGPATDKYVKSLKLVIDTDITEKSLFTTVMNYETKMSFEDIASEIDLPIRELVEIVRDNSIRGSGSNLANLFARIWIGIRNPKKRGEIIDAKLQQALLPRREFNKYYDQIKQYFYKNGVNSIAEHPTPSSGTDTPDIYVEQPNATKPKVISGDRSFSCSAIILNPDKKALPGNYEFHSGPESSEKKAMTIAIGKCNKRLGKQSLDSGYSCIVKNCR